MKYSERVTYQRLLPEAAEPCPKCGARLMQYAGQHLHHPGTVNQCALAVTLIQSVARLKDWNRKVKALPPNSSSPR